MSKRAIFIFGQKGGVGKSIFAGALLNYFRSNNITCAGFDTDFGIRHLLQYCGGATSLGQDDPLGGVHLINLSDPRQKDGLINILDNGYNRILVDMPGNSTEHLADGFGVGTPAKLVKDYASEGYRITIATVITPLAKASEAPLLALDNFGDLVDYVVVKNLFWGEWREYPFFDGYEDDGVTRGEFAHRRITEVGGKIIGLPRLRSDTFALIDKYRLNFHEASEDRRLKRADRSRVFQWREDCLGHFRHASQYLGLDPIGNEQCLEVAV